MQADGFGGASSGPMIGHARGVLLVMAGVSLAVSSYDALDALRLTLHRDGRPDDLVASAADDLLHVPRSQVNNDQACSGSNLWALLSDTGIDSETHAVSECECGNERT
jgi:hypothetical protein